MTRKNTLLTLALFASTLTGCAGLTPPNAKDMTQITNVRYGENAPNGKEFIIFYPAGVALPIVASVNGTLLAQEDQATLHVTLKRDIYVFKQWVSFDGQRWQSSRDLLSSNFAIEIPGIRDGKNPGKLHAEFNLK